MSKEPVEHCDYPLEASGEFLNNLYFRVFSPNHSYMLQPVEEDSFHLPEKLDGWLMAKWIPADEGWGHKLIWVNNDHTVPVKPTESPVYRLGSSVELTLRTEVLPMTDNRILAIPMIFYQIGFNSKSPNVEVIKRVIGTFTIL